MRADEEGISGQHERGGSRQRTDQVGRSLLIGSLFPLSPPRRQVRLPGETVPEQPVDNLADLNLV